MVIGIIILFIDLMSGIWDNFTYCNIFHRTIFLESGSQSAMMTLAITERRERERESLFGGGGAIFRKKLPLTSLPILGGARARRPMGANSAEVGRKPALWSRNLPFH